MKKYLADFRESYGVHISTNMSGKMRDVWTLSTSCKCNPICECRSKVKGSICEHCFAQKTIAHYGDLAKRLKDNFDVLTTTVIPVNDFPDIQERDIFRIESFGDLANTTQALNYLHLVKRNPKTMFALWTKNPIYLARALEDFKKPKNLVIIQSSMYVNCPDEPAFDFIDKVFTVYTPEHASRHGVKINCGARSCNTCRRCYSKRTGKAVNELLK